MPKGLLVWVYRDVDRTTKCYSLYQAAEALDMDESAIAAEWKAGVIEASDKDDRDGPLFSRGELQLYYLKYLGDDVMDCPGLWPWLDSTRNGITHRHDKLILVGDGIPEIFNTTNDAPAIYLERRERFNDMIARPSLTDGKHYMFGGNFIYSSDSRFPSSQPIKVHDRWEG